MEHMRPRHREAVCQQLRTRTLHHLYGPKVKEFNAVPESLLAELYPFDYAFLTTHVENLLTGVGDFDMEQAHHHAFRNRKFLHMMRSMVDPGSWYDNLDMVAEGLLAYRIEGYTRVSGWSRRLEQQFPKAVSQQVTNRLGKAVTILICADELDESYFMGPHAMISQYTQDPKDVFTALIDWFIEFLDAYKQLAQLPR